MKKKLLRAAVVVIAVFLTLFAAFAIWSSDTLGPDPVLWSVVSENDYETEGDFIIFQPNGTPKNAGLVLYPGAKVDPLAYALLAKTIAADGYLVCILDVSFHLALFDIGKAAAFIDLHPEIGSWYVAGHSMGGVAAAFFASDHPDVVDGLILLASYPAASTDLAGSALRVLSIYAENDGLTLVADIDESKSRLPDDATYLMIEGGNHAGFGLYGEQRGDGAATIDALLQQDEIAAAFLAFLADVPSA